MIIIKNLFRIILILILLTIIAQSKESDKINKNEWVISLEQYFLNLGNIEGSFTQIDQIGNITKGIFYSNGNGSLRFEYFSPSEMLIIVNKGIFAIKERENSKINYYSLEDSPLSKLLSKDLSLESFHVNGLEIQGRIATLELRTKKIQREIQYLFQPTTLNRSLDSGKSLMPKKKRQRYFFQKLKRLIHCWTIFFSK